MSEDKVIALEVVELGSGKLVKAIDVRGTAQVAKAEMGLLRNMDLDRFGVQRRYESGKVK